MKKFVVFMIFALTLLAGISFVSSKNDVIADLSTVTNLNISEIFNGFTPEDKVWDLEWDELTSDKDQLIYEIELNAVLDGQNTIIQNFTLNLNKDNKALFTKIQGLNIKNLNFKNAEIVIEAEELGNYGVLAESIINSKIEGVSFENIKVVYSNNQKVSQLNIGLIAGKCEDVVFNNTKLNGINFISGSYKTGANGFVLDGQGNKIIEDGEILSNINLGLYSGYAEFSTIKNCKIDNYISNDNKITSNLIKIIHNGQLTTSVNVGSIYGNALHSKTYNAIVNTSISATNENSSAVFAIGGMVGLSQGNNTELINNIFVGDISATNITRNIGSCFGILKTTSIPDNNKLLYFKTTSTLVYFGNFLDGVSYDTSRARFDNTKQLNTFYREEGYNVTEWEPVHYWDFVSKWNFVGGETFPELQSFMSFTIEFSQDNSLSTLRLDENPKFEEEIDGVKTPGKIIETDFVHKGAKEEGADVINNIVYNDSVEIITKITSKNGYNKFFYIKGLQYLDKKEGLKTLLNNDEYINFDVDFTYKIDESLNTPENNVNISTIGKEYKNPNTGETPATILEYMASKGLTILTVSNQSGSKGLTIMVEDNGSKITYSSNFNEIVLKIDVKNDYDNSYSYKIPKINDNTAGTYSVSLVKYKYIVNLKALQEIDSGNSLIKETGKVINKNDSNLDNAKKEVSQKVEYGLTYNFRSVPNFGYGSNVLWQLGKDDNFVKVYGQKTTGEITTDILSNELKFSFSEKTTEGLEVSFVDLLNDVTPSKDGAAEISDYFTLTFNTNINYVKFEYYVNNEIANSDFVKNIQMLKGGRQVETILGEDETYRTWEFIIGDTSEIGVEVPEGYDFDSWKVNRKGEEADLIGLAQRAILMVEDSGEIVVKVYFTYVVEESDVNLTWLWISLGAVGGIGLIVAIVVIARKKKKNNAYKNSYIQF